MRMRTKIANEDGLPEVIAISADNDEERKILLGIYTVALKEISKLYGKSIHPYSKSETSRRRIYSEQAPIKANKRSEAYRKGRTTQARNKAIRDAAKAQLRDEEE